MMGVGKLPNSWGKVHDNGHFSLATQLDCMTHLHIFLLVCMTFVHSRIEQKACILEEVTSAMMSSLHFVAMDAHFIWVDIHIGIQKRNNGSLLRTTPIPGM